MAHFYGAPPMAMLTVGAGTLLLGKDVIGLRLALDIDWVLWFGGTILGIVLSFGTRWAMLHIAPASLPQAVVPSWWPIAGMIAIGGALLGSIYPGVMAVRQDPIEALAYE